MSLSGTLRAAVILVALGETAPGHEFWIAPQDYRPAPGAEVALSFKVGEELDGRDYPYFPDAAFRFDYATGADLRPARTGPGRMPAGRIEAAAGLGRVVYQSGADLVHYSAWEDFVAYLRYEGLEDRSGEHLDRGLAREDFTEAYYRMAKTLIQSGAPRRGQSDSPVGLPLELVADGNPYARMAGDRQAFTLFWRDAPRADHPVSVFWIDRQGDVRRELLRTDADGRVELKLQKGVMLLNSVELMVPPEDFGADWISAWASLTFEVS